MSKFLYYLLICLQFSHLVKTQGIAVKKCKEYSQIMQNKSCPMFVNPLIVGGETAREKEFPHMVALAYIRKDSLTWKCGGSLISEKHVLTAAHCCTSHFGLPIVARMGSRDLAHPSKYTQDRLVLDAKINPYFKQNEKYNDLAILFLNKPVTFTDFVRPACLNIEVKIDDKEAEVIGFGKQHRVADHHHTHNPLLHKVFIDIIPRNVCKENIMQTKELQYGINDGLICAGMLKTGGKDACQGDSGGPLQVVMKDVYCMFKILGVVSAGNHCAMAYDPGLYTNLAFYIRWIESIVWPPSKLP